MFTSVVLAGAAGSIGSPLLRKLLESSSPTFQVTVLTRKGHSTTDTSSKQTPSSVVENPRQKTVAVDYNDHASLVQALSGADVVVSALPNPVIQTVDHLLLRAAQEAGVRRIFPSEYTLDVLHPAAVAAFGEESPVVQSARKFVSLAESDSVTSFTTIVTGMFTDLALGGGLLNIWNWTDLQVTSIDGGDKVFTTSSTEFVAASIVAALKMDEEKTKNRRIRIAENQTTIRGMTSVLEEVAGCKFQAIELSSQELSKRKEEADKTGDKLAMYVNPLLRVNFDGSGAGNFQEGLEFGAEGEWYVPRKSLKELAQEVMKSR
ncbi:hypothetical protein N0V82_005831 [Gnomoniopsis sp. IMI 355080]|nr:hypothetical protein N0V82_005831 [Gnomoniopsis sp. IMI 355080]